MAECYTEMSEESDIEASDSEEIEICTMVNLKPYDMEPRRKCEHGEVEFTSQSNSSSDNETEQERIGNIDWCDCGKNCRAMETHTESLCCQDTNEIQEHLFTGKMQLFRILIVTFGDVFEIFVYKHAC